MSNVDRFTEDGLWYDSIADDVYGGGFLTSEEAETAFRTRRQAIESFEENGATVCPYSNIIAQTVWLKVQANLSVKREFV